jgi:phospholipase C
MFDENDGFFDHVPPPAAPSYNADGTLAGNSTVPLAGEYFSDPEHEHLLPQDTISGSLRPWGLGARVPMYVISPWSRGGWVDSQVYDHTSIGMFLEQRFGIVIDSISPWRRAVCGDLTAAFDFASPNLTAAAPLPDVSDYAAIEAAQRALPPPTPPASPAPLFQETGTRPSRALPYELHTSARVAAAGSLTLLFSNSGAKGAVLHVYDVLHLDRIPRRYTVEAGKLLTDTWNTGQSDQGAYDLWVYGPNGFVRHFQGNTVQQAAATFKPEIQICYEPTAGQIWLKVHNTGGGEGSVSVTANAYLAAGSWSLHVGARSIGTLNWDLSSTGNWYDFTVSTALSQRRYAGRMETGADGISDPAMAAGL